jgi:hypothetical protein
MNDLILLESVSARNEKLSNLSQDASLDHLNRAKSLVMAMWQGTGVATTEQMAGYYEVSIDTVKMMLTRHRDEFESDGVKEIKGKDLKVLYSQGSNGLLLPEKVTRLNIWTPRAALRLGMLLRDSEIAKQVRTLLLDVAMLVPQQNDRLRELELINENMRLEIQRMDRMSSMTALHGVPTTLCLMGRDNAIVEVEKPTIEVIDDRHNQQTKYSGQTCTQLKDYMKKRFGITFRSGADVQRVLEEIETKFGVSLLAELPRTVTTTYIPDEHTSKAIEYLRDVKNWQMLIGQ